MNELPYAETSEGPEGVDWDDFRVFLEVVRTGSFNRAAAKLKMLVEEQVTGGRAVLYRQCCERLIFNMELHHAPEINGADHVDIVQKERFIHTGGIVQKKVSGSFQSATGIEQ